LHLHSITLYDEAEREVIATSNEVEMSYLFRGRGQPPPQPARDKDRAKTQLLPETSWNVDSSAIGTPPENKIVVTIARQYGSGGAEIGHIVAQKSGLLYVDHEIIGEVARRLGVNEEQAARQDEQTAGTIGHILEALRSSSPFNLNYNTLVKPNEGPAPAREAAYLRLTQSVILELATKGDVVIIGRGSQFLLHGAPRTLHIYTFAPLEYRVARIMQRFQIDRASAKELIERRDSEHNAYMNHYYGGSQNQTYLYHLLINTGLITYELAANLILQTLPLVKSVIN
jgi:cytidylate kinase